MYHQIGEGGTGTGDTRMPNHYSSQYSNSPSDPYRPVDPSLDMQQVHSHMAKMSMEESIATGTVRRKKRDRHAHHEIQPQGTSQAFNGMPQGNLHPTQFLDQQNPPVQEIPPHPHTGEYATPAMSQFPATTNPSYISGQHLNNPDHITTSFSTQGYVDPAQLPSIPALRDRVAEYYLNQVYSTTIGRSLVPPPAAIPFVAIDQGNSSPKFARLTMVTVPESQDLLNSTHLPLALILQPLAPLQEGENVIPVLDFGEAGPPRCRRCRTYINPSMQFKQGGAKFVCNMCAFPNDVPNNYYAPLTPQLIRVDREQRPELMLGTVEFVVPKEYWSRDPAALHWLFLIDVTADSIKKGFVPAVCDGIMSTLYGSNHLQAEDDQQLPKGSRVGIVTYDRKLQFYNLGSNLEQAQMLVMPDLMDPFVPLSEGLFVDPYECEVTITTLLKQVPQIFAPDIHHDLADAEPALVPALQAATQALAATGGKIVCSLGALPMYGPGQLFLRDTNKAVAGTDAERKLLTTEHPSYLKMAHDMCESGIGIDFFLATPYNGYLDIATIGHLSAKTGGEVFYYPNFISRRDDLKISKEITHTVTRETGYQALIKVRCSNGLQVSGYHGNFTHRSLVSDLEFGSIDQDKAISVQFSYDGKLDAKQDVYFQSALLYTTASGQRRVRCHNLAAGVTTSGGRVLEFVDQDAVLIAVAKEAASKIPEKSPNEVRDTITTRCVEVLSAYRKNFANQHHLGQLVLPEKLKGFGMNMLGMIKVRAFKNGIETTDRRIHEIRMVRSMGALEMSLYLYPRIFGIHNMGEKDGFANENGTLKMPNSVRASFLNIDEGGAYIMDNGQICLLWFHTNVSPLLLEDLFGPGVDSLNKVDPMLTKLPILETHRSAQVRNILQSLALNRGSKAMSIQIARQRLDGAEAEFARLLFEDRNNETRSYSDWLAHIHRYIQDDISGDRKKDIGEAGIAASTMSSFRQLWF